MEYARVLSEQIGSRPAGSEAELSAAEYIRGQLDSLGYDAELQPFPITTYLVLKSDLSVARPGGNLDIDATPFTRSASGSISGGAFYADLGYADDFTEEAEGRIALIERGEITFSEKIANAVAAGATAAVIINNNGGPFGGTLATEVSIPVVSISGEDGETLRDLLNQGDITLMLDVEIQASEATSNNVIAEPPDGKCRIIAGGHYDSVPTGPGANDNASGTAVVMEMARVLAPEAAADEICFALFGSEEIGLVGSQYYVNNQTPGALSTIRAMLNFDMLAVGDGWPLGGSTDIVDLASGVAADLGITYRIDSGGTGGSDHASFIDVGVPAILFNCFCDPNYHTAADRFEFLSQERLGEAGALGLGLIERLLEE